MIRPTVVTAELEQLQSCVHQVHLQHYAVIHIEFTEIDLAIQLIWQYNSESIALAIPVQIYTFLEHPSVDRLGPASTHVVSWQAHQLVNNALYQNSNFAVMFWTCRTFWFHILVLVPCDNARK